jgi:hypothetical protein
MLTSLQHPRHEHMTLEQPPSCRCIAKTLQRLTHRKKPSCSLRVTSESCSTCHVCSVPAHLLVTTRGASIHSPPASCTPVTAPAAVVICSTHADVRTSAPCCCSTASRPSLTCSQNRCRAAFKPPYQMKLYFSYHTRKGSGDTVQCYYRYQGTSLWPDTPSSKQAACKHM